MLALRPRSARPAGATLVEMVLTVAVLGIAALITIPRADPAGSLAADAVAGEIANALRFGQQEAIRTGRYHIVNIDPATQTLSVFRLTGRGVIRRDASVEVLHPVDRRAYLITLNNNSLSSSTIVGSVFRYEGGGVENFAAFGPDGAPANINGAWFNGVPAGRAPLQGDGVVTIRHGEAERQVRLDPVTGRVTY